MKNVIITSLMFLVLILSGISFYFSRELNLKEAEMNEKEVVSIQDEKVEEEVLDQISDDKKKIGKKEASNQNSELEDELAVYKNEKYNYSFKYPKGWYVYDDVEDLNKCYEQEISKIPSKDFIVLSRNKKADCEAGLGIMGSSLGGDIYIEIYKSEKDYYPFYIKKEEFHDSGLENYKIGSVDAYMKRFIASEVEGEVFLKDFTRIYVRRNGYDHKIGVKQLDDKGNIDPELMKVIDSISIEK